MRYLHTMVRVTDVEKSLDFYCNKLGMREVRRTESEAGRFTLIFLATGSVGTICRWSSISRSSNPSARPSNRGRCKIGEFAKLCGARAFLVSLITHTVTITVKFLGKTASHL